MESSHLSQYSLALAHFPTTHHGIHLFLQPWPGVQGVSILCKAQIPEALII